MAGVLLQDGLGPRWALTGVLKNKGFSERWAFTGWQVCFYRSIEK
jgi:hypothetical protein